MKRILPAFLMASLALPSVAQAYQFKRTEGGVALHWAADSAVSFVLHRDGVDDIDDGSDLQAVRDAFGAWQSIDGMTVSLQEGGQTGTIDAGYDQDHPDSNTNTVAWIESDWPFDEAAWP